MRTLLIVGIVLLATALSLLTVSFLVGLSSSHLEFSVLLMELGIPALNAGLGCVLLFLGLRGFRSRRLILRLLSIGTMIVGALFSLSPLTSLARLLSEEAIIAKNIGQNVEGQDSGRVYHTTDRQIEIMREVIRVDGQLTETMHEEFWSPLRALSTDAAELEDALSSIRMEFRSRFGLAQQYQHEVWTCASSSYEEEVVVRTALLEDLEAELRAKAPTQALRERYDRNFANTDLLLRAAANRGVLETPGRDPVEVSPELIATVRGGIDDAFGRVDRLFDPVWRDDASLDP